MNKKSPYERIIDEVTDIVDELDDNELCEYFFDGDHGNMERSAAALGTMMSAFLDECALKAPVDPPFPIQAHTQKSWTRGVLIRFLEQISSANEHPIALQFRNKKSLLDMNEEELNGLVRQLVQSGMVKADDIDES